MPGLKIFSVVIVRTRVNTQFLQIYKANTFWEESREEILLIYVPKVNGVRRAHLIGMNKSILCPVNFI